MTKYVITTTDMAEFVEFANSSSEAISRFLEDSVYTVDEIISCVSGFEIQPAK